ncbi:Neprosin [Dillenia turbinata]|uniref:Neprosin n=1 Tax=Dillenia turbinata TaxID=194707 RepID=A0AAN8UHR5_9MAGN
MATTCYNHDCPGFTHINKVFHLGAKLEPVSTYNGKQYEIFIFLYKIEPAESSLAASATSLGWVGEILNRGMSSHHTTMQIGSGHFAGEGYGEASISAFCESWTTAASSRHGSTQTSCNKGKLLWFTYGLLPIKLSKQYNITEVLEKLQTDQRKTTWTRRESSLITLAFRSIVKYGSKIGIPS